MRGRITITRKSYIRAIRQIYQLRAEGRIDDTVERHLIRAMTVGVAHGRIRSSVKTVLMPDIGKMVDNIERAVHRSAARRYAVTVKGVSNVGGREKFAIARRSRRGRLEPRTS